MRNVRIPFATTTRLVRDGICETVPDGIEITPDLASQIVAASALAGKFAALEANVLHRLATHDSHIEALEHSAKIDAHCAHLDSPESQARVDAMVETLMAYKAPDKPVQPEVDPCGFDRESLSRMEQPSAQDKPACVESAQDKPAQPDADDAAAIDAIAETSYETGTRGRKWADAYPDSIAVHEREARAILAAIRAGKVPGIYAGALYAAQLEANAALRAQVEAVTRERDEARGNVRAWMSAREVVITERDATLAALAATIKAKQENDERFMIERDEARADLAAAKERAERAERAGASPSVAGSADAKLLGEDGRVEERS